MLLRLRRYLVFCFPVLILTASAFAALPTFWILENQADFLSGEVEGLSIASDGTISLAPETRNLYEATDPFFWSLVSDGDGNLYAGSGNDGKVYRVDPSGQAEVVADTNELVVHSLAIDRQGNLFAATSPRGSVYKIGSDGSQEVFFDPDDRYIWAMAVDNAGNLLVATGEKGNLYRVSPSGESEALFESQETHLVCLTIDDDGNIYAGSDSNGLVFKIDRNGKASVLFDTPFEEIHELILDSRGNVYAAAINGGARAQAPAPTPAPTPTPAPGQPPATAGGVTESVTVTVSAATPVATPPATHSGALKGALYRIRPDGSAETLWQSSENTPLSLKLERDDRIMVGTGNDGRIFLVRQDKTSSLLARVEADQVTSIFAPERGAVHFATSNPARVYRLAEGRRAEGVYRSPIKDTNAVSSMGKIRWDGRAPAGTGLSIQTRTGNSAKPDNTWSAWSDGYSNQDGDQITSPRGRFLQWRAIFKSDGNATPELAKVTAIYLQQNLSPTISEITLYPPGQTFQKPIVATGQNEIMGLDRPVETPQLPPSSGTTPGVSTMNPPSLPPTAYSRTFYRKGFQTVTWTASDPNDDQLRYNIYYRGDGETLWKSLREDVPEAVIAWDTVAMPDGRYNLKVVASDSPNNPEDLALTGEKESRSFDVDNTPPSIGTVQTTKSPDGHRLVFEAQDDSSAVKKVEYSVDSGNWKVVYPNDGIADSKRESFDFSVPGYTDGVYTLVVKVTDLLNNVATARVELR
jgi:sugar lactone lactonase YvrE